MRWICAVAAVAVAACAAPKPKVKTTYYPDGTKKSEAETVNGVPHGTWRTYHPNGNIACVITYTHGRRDRMVCVDEENNAGKAARYVYEAEPRPVVRETPEDVVPTFATLDRTDGELRIEARWGRQFYNNDVLTDGQRASVHAQVPFDRWGVYATVAGATVNADDGFQYEGVVAPELGGFAVLSLGGGALVPKLGLTVPSEDEFDIASAVDPEMATARHRLTDLALSLPNVFVLRPSASYLGDWRWVHYRLDAGLDLVFDNSDEADAARLDDDFELLGRANAGAWLGEKNGALLVELSNTAMLTDDDERFVHSVAIGARLGFRNLYPSISAIFPLDEEVRGDWIMSLAVEYAQHR